MDGLQPNINGLSLMNGGCQQRDSPCGLTALYCCAGAFRTDLRARQTWLINVQTCHSLCLEHYYDIHCLDKPMCLYVNIYNVLVVLLVNLNSILASYRVHELRRQARRGLISSGKARRGLISSGKTGNRFLSTKLSAVQEWVDSLGLIITSRWEPPARDQTLAHA